MICARGEVNFFEKKRKSAIIILKLNLLEEWERTTKQGAVFSEAQYFLFISKNAQTAHYLK